MPATSLGRRIETWLSVAYSKSSPIPWRTTQSCSSPKHDIVAAETTRQIARLAADGSRIGIEITELVDGRSVAAARIGKPYDWKDWKNALLPELQKILHRKDNPTEIKGGPYSEYVLLIFSDEPWLEREYVERSLAEHIFERTSVIGRAFLLLSYDPHIQRYPCYELRMPPTMRWATCEDARA